MERLIQRKLGRNFQIGEIFCPKTKGFYCKKKSMDTAVGITVVDNLFIEIR